MEITLEKTSQAIVMHEMEIMSKRQLLCQKKENCTTKSSLQIPDQMTAENDVS